VGFRFSGRKVFSRDVSMEKRWVIGLIATVVRSK
jgi:hypothetical protein